MGIEETVAQIRTLDEEAKRQARERQDLLTKPQGSLGMLEELSIKIAGIKGTAKPELRRKVIFTMAGDHGVVQEGVSAFPQEVTSQMVFNFIAGGAGINVLAKHVGAEVIVVDMGVAYDFTPSSKLVDKKIAKGTKNMVKGPAMNRDEAIKAIGAGIDVFEDEFKKRSIDIVGIGDMGIGNTTASSAIAAAISGKEVREITGRGTGINGQVFENKVNVIKRALEINKPSRKDPIEILAKVGGFEIGGLAGVCLAAAARGVPIVIDGFIATAGAMIAVEIAPIVRDYMIAAHKSVEAGHVTMLEHLGLSPLLDFNLRLGEGTGAALGISIAEASVRILSEMATFEEAGVSEGED
ncbi:MAG: nicotinate-nucleotide--dimethylbenzimidazole phosphoribosyltransferase [Candidatus Hydrothermarchaeaceae archaeon]